MAVLNLTIKGDNRDALNAVTGVEAKIKELDGRKIKIELDRNGIESIQQLVASIPKDPIQIKVEASGVDAITREMVQYAKYTAQAAAEERKLEAQRTKTAQAAAKQSAEETKLALAKEKTAQEAAKQAAAEAKAAQEMEKTARAAAKQAAQEAEAARAAESFSGSMDGAAQRTGEVVRASGDIADGFTKVRESITEVDKEWTQTATTFKNAAGDEIKQVEKLNGKFDEMGNALTSVSETTTQKFVQALTDEEKAMHTAAVQAGLLTEAQGKLIDSQEVWRDGQLVKAVKTYRDSLGNVTKVVSELDGNMARVTTTTRTNSEQMKRQADAAELAAKKNSLLGDSLDRIVAKIVAWQVINASVAAMIRSFTQAVDTLKEADTELTNIQKVTGRTKEEMKSLSDTAFEVASAYGVSANDYLASVAEFAKAGFGDQAEKLAEIATKTQLVGDVSADAANQFILSANAAWQYEGSISDLTSVLDKANAVENNFATSIDKIASGFPIVAAVAAQAGMSVDETIAAIGTITSVTQESGEKAATALRALILNIEGAVGEYEDGISVTEESIKSLNDVLNLYAADAMKAAEAQGKMIDPMTAIAALSEAAKEGLLSEKELFDLLSGLGGKMRTNQLTALVTNFDLLNRQLEVMRHSAGSADEEMDIMLSSWEAKTNILQNTWTQFISHLVNTDAVKLALDGLTGAVKLLDSGLGGAAASAAAGAAAFSLLERALTAFFGSSLYTVTQEIAALNAGLQFVPTTAAAAAYATGGLTAAVKALTASLLASPLFWGAAAAVAVYGIVKAVDALTTTYEEQLEVVQKLKREYEEQFGYGSEYDKLKTKVDSLTDSERVRLNVLEGQKVAAEEALKAEEKLASQKWLEENTRKTTFLGGNNLGNDLFDASAQSTNQFAEAVDELKKAVAEADAEMGRAEISAERYKSKISLALNETTDYYNGLIQAKNAGIDLRESEEAFIKIYETNAETLARVSKEKIKEARATRDQAEAVKTVQQETDELEKQIRAANAALSDFKAYGELTTDAMESLSAELPDVADALFDETGALNEAGKAAFEAAGKLDSAKASTEYLQAAANAANYSNLIGQINSVKIAAADSMAQLAALAGTVMGITDPANLEGLRRTAYERAKANGTSTQAEYQKILTDYANQQIAAAQSTMSTVTASRSKQEKKTGRSSGGGGKDPQQIRLDELKQAVEDEKARYALMEAQKASAEALAAQAGKVQEALHNQAEYMRDIHSQYADVASLSREWYEWEEKKAQIVERDASYAKDVSDAKQQLSFLEASGAAEEDRIDQLRKIQEYLHSEAEYLRSIGAEEAEVLALSTEWWSVEGQIQDILEAQAEAEAKLAEEERKRAEEAEKARRAAMQNAVTANESLYSFLESAGAGGDELNAQLDVLEEKTRAYITYLGDVEDSEEEILSMSQKLLDIQQRRAALQEAIAQKEKEAEEAARKRLADEAQYYADLADMYEKLGFSENEILSAKESELEALAAQLEYANEHNAEQSELFRLVSQIVGVQQEMETLSAQIAENAGAAAKAQLDFLERSAAYKKTLAELARDAGLPDETVLDYRRQYTRELLRQFALLEQQSGKQQETAELAQAILKAKQDELDLEQELARAETERQKKAKEAAYKTLADMVSLRQSELTLVEKISGTDAERIAKLEQIADAMAEQGRFMERNGYGQAEINQLAAKWLDIQSEILDIENGMADAQSEYQRKRLSFFQSAVSLAQSQLELLEMQGDRESEQIAKYRQILSLVERVGTYQKEIGESVEAQNKTAVQYYRTLRDLLRFQQTQFDSLVSGARAYIDAERELAVGPLKDELELRKAAHEEQEDATKLAEKQLEVEKARQGLLNAQRQRTVYIYNRDRNRFERVANPRTVQAAQDALDKAQKDLTEYQYELENKRLQKQIDALEDSFDELTDAIVFVSGKIRDGEMTFRDAYAYISSKMKAAYDRYGVDLTAIMTESIRGFEQAADGIGAVYREIRSVKLAFGDVNAELRDLEEELGEDSRRLTLLFGSLNGDLTRAADDLEDTANALDALPAWFRRYLDTLSGVLEEGGDRLSGAVSVLDRLPDSVRGVVESLRGGFQAAEARVEEAVDLFSSFPEDIRAILDRAIAAIRGGGSVGTGGTGASGGETSEEQSDIDRMRRNSIAWHSASDAQRRQLEQENRDIAAKYGYSYRNGAWYYPGSNQVVYDITGGSYGVSRYSGVMTSPEYLSGARDFAASQGYVIGSQNEAGAAPSVSSVSGDTIGTVNNYNYNVNGVELGRDLQNASIAEIMDFIIGMDTLGLN